MPRPSHQRACNPLPIDYVCNVAMEEIEASSNVEEGGEQDLQVTQLELEQGAYEAFRVLVKNIASEITDGRQLEMLGYFQNIPAADCKQKSSLEMLDEMMRKGKFSHTNVQPLKKTLENIDRTDLIRMVDQYNHTYMEAIIQVQSIRSSRSKYIASYHGINKGYRRG